MNRTACRKILKKYDKKIGTSVMTDRLRMVEVLFLEPVSDLELLLATSASGPRKGRSRVCDCAAAAVMRMPGRTPTAKRASFAMLCMLLFAGICACWYMFQFSGDADDAVAILFQLGVAFAFVLAWANGANDIANSVGTSVGAGALTVGQALFLGSVAEALGALTMGSFVSKTISKGVIEPQAYADEPEQFALAMLCVLIGSGAVTLLATVYGFPISATHSIIGSLLAIGWIARGPGSLGWNKLASTAVSWVLSPLVGAVTAAALYTLIEKTTMEDLDTVAITGEIAGARSRRLQPIFMVLTCTTCLCFIFLKGPDTIKIEPWWAAVLVSLAISVFVVTASMLAGKCRSFGTAEGEVDVALPPVVDGKPREENPAAKKRQTVLMRRHNTGRTGKFLGTASAALFASESDDSDDVPDELPGVRPPTSALQSARGAGEHLARMALAGTNAHGLPVEVKLDVHDESKHAPSDVAKRRRLPAPTRGVSEAGSISDDEREHREAKMEKRRRRAASEGPFVPLLAVSALSVAFAHGGNDVGNAVGPLASIYEIYSSGNVETTPEIPFWALTLGAGGFVLGIYAMGHRTIDTVGNKITKLTPSRSYATQMGAAVAVLGSSVLGMPVSTSHCLVGAVVGVGLAQRYCGSSGGSAKLNFKMLQKIVVGWLVTIPLAMLAASIIFAPVASLLGHKLG
jgi:phosphate/sulfate permease